MVVLRGPSIPNNVRIMSDSEKAMAPHCSTLAWKIPWAEEPGGLQSVGSQLRDFTFTSHFHALEKEMATHSSVLAWRIPRTGKLGRLPSMGSHRVRQDWSDLAAAMSDWKRSWCWERLKAKEKRAVEEEMVRLHHWLNGHELEQTLGDSEGQGSLVCCP